MPKTTAPSSAADPQQPLDPSESQEHADQDYRSTYAGVLPTPIQRMLDRALRSFGSDRWVLANRWIETVRADGAGAPRGGIGKTESAWFAYSKVDICCGDVASWTLYQTGLIPQLATGEVWDTKRHGQIHSAFLFEPTAGLNDDWLILLAKGRSYGDFFATADEKDHRPLETGPLAFLPGDVLLYSNPSQQVRYHPPGEPSHVNVYLGPFCRYVNGQPQAPVYHLINGSLGMTESSKDVGPRIFWKNWDYHKKNGHEVWHVRHRALDRAYREWIGVPLSLPGPASEMDAAWDNAKRAQAPYPVGRKQTWHQGIHLRDETGAEPAVVLAFAPGRVRLARFGVHSLAGDVSMVMVEHQLAPDTLLLRTPGTEHKDGDAPLAPLYSLYMHLAPLGTYLRAADPAGTLPDLDRSRAPLWLQRIWPPPIPEQGCVIDSSAKIQAVSYEWDAATGAVRPVILGTVLGSPPSGIGLDIDTGLSLQGKPYKVIGCAGDGWDLDLAPLSLSAPASATVLLYNPLSGRAVSAQRRPRGADSLRCQPGQPALGVIECADGPLYPIDGGYQPRIDLATLAAEHFDLSSAPVSQGADEPAPVAPASTAGAGQVLTILRDAVSVLLGEGRVALRRSKRDGALAFRVAQIEGSVAHLELVPCVKLPAQRAQEMGRLLSAHHEWAEQVRARIQRGQSKLWEAYEGPGEGWSFKGDLVSPRGSGRKSAARLMVPGGDSGAADRPQQQLGDLRKCGLLPVAWEVIDLGHRRALLEIQYIVQESAVRPNDQEIEQAHTLRRQREPIARDLLSGALVDLSSAPGITLDLRSIAREKIGESGGLDASDPSSRGVHFEIFAGRNLVDPAVPGTDGAIVEVPGTDWLVLRRTGEEDLFNQRFMQGLLAELKRLQRGGHISLVGDPLRDVPTEAEWLKFCDLNQRALASLITVHPSEWTIDWPARTAQDGHRGAHASADGKDRIESETAPLMLSASSLSLPGVTGRELWFYHPLRFIEWLGTGIDVSVEAPPQVLSQQKVTWTPDHGPRDPVTLPLDAVSGQFCLRTCLEPGVESRRGVLALEGLPYRLPVTIKRGAVTYARVLLRPQLMIEAEPADERHQADAIQSPHSLALNQDFVSDGTYLLADGDHGPLKSSAYSVAQLSIVARFNVAPPETIEVSLSSDAFALVGARSAEPKGSAIKVIISLDAKRVTARITRTQALASFTAPACVGIKVQVAVATLRTGATAELTVTARHGEFQEDGIARHTLRTREIRLSKQPAVPRLDVAKLQLYLALTPAAPFLPESDSCLVREWIDNQKAGTSAPAGQLHIDGLYGLVKGAPHGEALARGVWRFLYTYVHAKEWDEITQIDVVDQRGQVVQPAKIADLREASLQRLLWFDPGQDQDAEYQQRVGHQGKAYASFPVLTAELVQSVMRYAQKPRLPVLSVTVQRTGFPPRSGISVQLDWIAEEVGVSALLPLETDEIDVVIGHAHGSAEADPYQEVVISLPKGSAYKLRNEGASANRIKMTLRQACAPLFRLRLGWSGQTNIEAKANTLTIHLAGGPPLAALPLAGARTLSGPVGGRPSRDAALIQFDLASLAQARRQAGGEAPWVAPAVTGRWDGPSAEALRQFRRSEKKENAKYADVLRALRAAVAREVR